MNKNNSLSVIVLSHNDELRIVDCLESISFADEIIVVDDKSTDRTVDLALQFTKKIYSRDLQNNFANQRNFALNKAGCEWIFFIDSDEIVSEGLKKEILEAIKMPHMAGFILRRIDYMWGRKIMHGEGGSVRLLRLARRGSGRWHGKVHETWQVKGKIGDLKKALIHIPHQSVGAFIKDIDDYSSLRVEELLSKNANSSFITIISYPLGKFFLNYVVKKGYKDGLAGFVYAMIMSFHSFLVRGKLFIKNNE